MLKKILIGGIGGGLLAFVWGGFSWMVSPWRDHGLQKFQDETAVAAVVKANVAQPGMYYLPYWSDGDKEAEEQMQAKMREGPLVFASVQLTGSAEMGANFAKGLLTQILAAVLVTWMVFNAGIASYRGRLVFVLVFALAAAVVGILPSWNWWGFSNTFTLIAFGDMLAGWLLAGLVIAKVTAPVTTKT